MHVSTISISNKRVTHQSHPEEKKWWPECRRRWIFVELPRRGAIYSAITTRATRLRDGWRRRFPFSAERGFSRSKFWWVNKEECELDVTIREEDAIYSTKDVTPPLPYFLHCLQLRFFSRILKQSNLFLTIKSIKSCTAIKIYNMLLCMIVQLPYLCVQISGKTRFDTTYLI